MQKITIHLNSLSKSRTELLSTKPVFHYSSSNNIQGIVVALAPCSRIPSAPPLDQPHLPTYPHGHRRSKGGAAKLSLWSRRS
ncbi:hypothetical protein TNCT_66531 [Trichonephila clavata]|uniref:Uncharacterized protein n=1 Tax=Trichonephila clavata TaxID=2740835 RepID=A0A8X6M1T5_TRICU|nr:hypothetical protein TNCT_66531 [Trichonephila clavata]